MHTTYSRDRAGRTPAAGSWHRAPRAAMPTMATHFKMATLLKRAALPAMAALMLTTSAPAAARSSPPVDVTIKRDSHGMPHVYAQTRYALFYGYGYAVAQDRLFQMEMIRRSTQGRVAEVLGEKYLAFDRSIRVGYSPERIAAQIAALPARQRDVLEGYAAGMNDWIATVRAAPQRWLPKDFSDHGFEPAEWTAFDVAMVFVGTVANRFSDSNTELDNLALLQALRRQHGADKGWQVFEQLKWRSDPKAVTTVQGGRPYGEAPAATGKAPPYPLAPLAGNAPVFDRLAQSPQDQGLLDPAPADRAAILADQLARIGGQGLPGFQTTSNIWIVGKSHAAGANALLLNGPQFGWFAPSYVYGIGLHGAGFDVVGNTPFAYPAVFFGHNSEIGWGSTAGVGDVVDIYAEKLDPQDPTRYWHQGQWKTMERRLDVIRVKGAAPVAVEVFRTVHGIVSRIDPKNQVAFARARTWEGQEVASLLAWVEQGRASDWTQWREQASRNATTINWYYADRRGNIGYTHTGFYPKRRAGHDPRLPVPGTGEWDWRGRLPFATNPQVYNPASGYLMNWNNAPMAGYGPTDNWAVLWTAADRAAELEQRLRDRLGQGRIDASEMWSLIAPTSFADITRRHFLPFLQDAVTALPADDPRARLVARLLDWDGLNTDRKGSGSYDHPGGAILDATLQQLLRLVLADDIPPDFFKWYQATGYPTPATPNNGSVNLAPGVKVLYNVLAGRDAGVTQRVDLLNGRDRREVIREALDGAWQALSTQYGSDPGRWQVPVAPLAFAANNFYGVPQADPGQAARVKVTMNRGTENNLTVLGRDRIRSRDVVAPGQSGFIAPDGKPSPHLRDQFELYTSFGNKPVWFTAVEVERDAVTTIRLRR